jgi:radical SAM superfamily enzyme YgiQ (UPF0313 family)
MQKKLLLINPWIYDFTAYDLWSKPLGLLYIASFLRKHRFDISYIDCMDKYDIGWQPKVKQYGQGKFYSTEIEKPEILKHIQRKYSRYGIPEKSFIERLQNLPKPDAVLITSIMTYWYLGPKKVVEIIREVYPGVPIILGGIYATLLSEHAKINVKPDYLITGLGEIKVLELLSKIFELDYKQFDIPASIDDFPYPAFDLINHPDYMIIMTARGCPYDCSFCAQKKISMPFTQRSPDNVFQELKYHYQKFKVRDFAFYDDALFTNKKKHIEIILEKVIDSRLPIRFHSPNGLFAKYIDERLAKLMYQSNFKTIRLSFETSNEDRRKDMYSKVSNDDMVKAVENLEMAGYTRSKIEAYALMGLPGQELTEIVATMIFLNNLGVQIKLASFSPIPGTLDFNRAVESGRISEDIDPLLTNKTIFPLSDDKINYHTFKKIRAFGQVLNFAAQKNLKPFQDENISTAIKSVLKAK